MIDKNTIINQLSNDVVNINYVEARYRPCPICSTITTEQNLLSTGSSYVKCDRCDFVYSYFYMSEKFFHENMVEPDMSHNQMLDFYVKNSWDREKEANEYCYSLSKYKFNAESNMLIVGSGVGHIYAALSGFCNVVGIDISARKLDLSRDIFDNQRTYNITAETMCYNNMFDSVFVRNALAWAEDPYLFVGKCIASLNPGGNLFIYNEDFTPDNSDKMYRLLWDNFSLSKLAEAFPTINHYTFDEIGCNYTKFHVLLISKKRGDNVY